MPRAGGAGFVSPALQRGERRFNERDRSPVRDGAHLMQGSTAGAFRACVIENGALAPEWFFSSASPLFAAWRSPHPAAYNPPMGTSEIDAWLAAGGMVVAASDRAARALTAAFHRARQSEGLSAWPAPQIFDWHTFARNQWSARDRDGRLLLTSTQERSLWAQIVQQGNSPATILAGPRRRIAALAMEAHELLAEYSPRHLQLSARHGWQRDTAVFSSWLSAFDKLCRKENLLSLSRVPLELAPLLASGSASRPPLLLVGFDRILPAQHTLFNAWGSWRNSAQAEPATDICFYHATDA